jgi:hypothetical protein
VSFQRTVASTFAFLPQEFGFQPVERSDFKVGELAEYRKDPLTVTIGWYKGEIDVNFTIALDFAAGHPVFRPYLSRTFALYEIATRQNPAAYADLSARMKGHGYVTNLDVARVYLEEAAKIVRRFCAPILQGDFSLLEEITRARSGRRP